MAEQLLPDEIDFAAYERETDCKAKVRRASDFSDDVRAALKPRGNGGRGDPEMLSTKLRGVLAFRPGEVTCWAGYNGAKKSMFLGQVVLDLCSQQQRVLVASMEMAPERTIARMAQQCSGERFPSGPWLENFDRWTDGKLWLFDHVGRISPRMCMAVCRYFAEELNGTHIVIDSMMMVCASEEHMDEQKQFVTDLVRIAQETGMHIHLVAHCRKPQNGGGEEKPPSKYDVRGSAAIVDQCPNIILVWWNKPKHSKLEVDPHNADALAMPDYSVTVEKQRNGEWEGRVSLWFHKPSLRFMNDRTSSVEPYVMVTSAA